MAKWSNVLEEAVRASAQPKGMTIYDSSGKTLLKAPLPTEFDGMPVLYSNRGLLQRLILQHATLLGIKIRYGTRVKEYFEEEGCAGVVIDGERIQADGVIAADGIHSAARVHVIGIKQHPRTSGFAVYRTCFELGLLANDPLTKHFAESKEDSFQVWLGPNVHAILFILVDTRRAVIFCTHKVTFCNLV